MIAAVMERCAGIDVGKKFIAVCVMTGPANGEARFETRMFGTTVAELKQARSWITEEAMHGGDAGKHGQLLETDL